ASLPVARLRKPYRRRTITSVSLAAKLSGVKLGHLGRVGDRGEEAAHGLLPDPLTPPGGVVARGLSRPVHVIGARVEDRGHITPPERLVDGDRKSTRLNSSHQII